MCLKIDQVGQFVVKSWHKLKISIKSNKKLFHLRIMLFGDLVIWLHFEHFEHFEFFLVEEKVIDVGQNYVQEQFAFNFRTETICKIQVNSNTTKRNIFI